MHTVSIVIPNYNGAKLLSKNLPKVLDAARAYYLYSKKPVDVIVVDDCSVDNSLDILNAFTSSKVVGVSIKVLKNQINKGFSSTVNKGVEASRSDVVILLNTDAYPESVDSFIKSFMYLFDDDNLFAVGFMDKSLEKNESIVLRGRGVGSWKKGFLVHKRGEIDSHDTLWVSGGSSAFSRSIWNKLGGLNEIYNPFYWEDIDLSYRAKKSGYQIMFYKKCVVIHEHEIGAIKSTRTTSQIKKIAYRNQILFSWLNLTDVKLILLHIVYLPLHVIRALLRLDTDFLIAIIMSIKNIFYVFNYRRKKRYKFKFGDAEVTMPFMD